MKRVTIKDIARQLGVNPSTVSRALNDNPDIGLALRTEIKQLADKLHYRPNQMAVHLRQRSSRLIGLITPEVTMFFYPSVIKGIQHVLHERGYNLMMLPSNESPEREIENIRICAENGVAGILLSVSRDSRVPDQFSLLSDMPAPVVQFDKTLEGLPFDAVLLEDFDSAYTAVSHLIETGCRNIAGIFGNPAMSITQLRLKGYRKALLDHGLQCLPEFECFSDDAWQAETCARKLLSAPTPPDGIFVMTDEVLIGALPAIASSVGNIPGDCAVICISDGFLPYCLQPQVTFLLHDGFEVGRLAAEKLLGLIESGEYKAPGYSGEKLMLQARLVELATTRPLE